MASFYDSYTVSRRPSPDRNRVRLIESRESMLLRQCNEAIDALKGPKVAFPNFRFVRVPRDDRNKPLPPFVWVQDRVRENCK